MGSCGKVFDSTSASPFNFDYWKSSVQVSIHLEGHTMEAACKGVNFPCSMVNGVLKLRTDDKQGYYEQIQGEFALSGLP